MQSLQLKLTHHAQKRLSKRLGIKTKEAALRFAQDVVKNGRIVPSIQCPTITIMRHGHSFVFVKGVDYSGNSILLMITACNDEKSSEWEWFHHGEVRKVSAIKKSKMNRRLC
ncbi:MAG: hypothetical protein PHQ22_08965 [Sulfuricurvum sp.]|nr:hypothetical protein [Sulfuricurvum sp.]